MFGKVISPHSWVQKYNAATLCYIVLLETLNRLTPDDPRVQKSQKNLGCEDIVVQGYIKLFRLTVRF